jgi:hypothetical protein
MTIEERIRSILTSGVATGDGGDDRAQLSMDDIGEVADIDTLRSAMRSEDGEPDDAIDRTDGDRE